LVENQAKELAVREEELSLRAKEIDLGMRYAEKSLDAQVKDRHEVREERRRARRDRLVILGVCAIVVIAFLVYLLETNKDAFAQEILKALVLLLTGGTSGYYAGKHQGQKQDDSGE
jgi:t-SNARE complex subunit (syntaxin)